MVIDIVQWWYEIGAVKHGPCSAESLRELIAGGQIDPGNLLWRKGLENWIQAGSTAEFAGAFAPEEPPPLPEKRPPTIPSTAGQAAPVSLWARFWARTLDGASFGLVIAIPAGALFGYAFPSFWIRFLRETQGGASLILAVVITPIWLIAEAFVLARYGTTPGKWVAGIIVRDHEGNLPSFKASLARSFYIWWRAYGLALPLVSLATLAFAYGQSKRAGGVAPWDKNLGLEVRAAIPRVRTVTAGVSVIVVTLLTGLVGAATQQITQRMVNAAMPPPVEDWSEIGHKPEDIARGPSVGDIAKSAQSIPFDKFDPKPGGFFEDGKPALGTYTFADGGKYVGEFKDGKQHGQGTTTWPDGLKYVGGFKDGKQHGQGTYTSPNGGKYVGEFKDGKQHGRATVTWRDGGKYVGEFKDGKKHGQGIEYHADGSILQSGIWENNVLVSAR